MTTLLPINCYCGIFWYLQKLSGINFNTSVSGIFGISPNTSIKMALKVKLLYLIPCGWLVGILNDM